MDAKIGAYGLVAVVLIAAIAITAFNSPALSGFLPLSKQPTTTQLPPSNTLTTTAPEAAPGASDGIDRGEVLPTQFALRQQYFEQVFQPRRETYKLFDQAAKKLGIPVSQVPAYFSLSGESDVFSQLPPIPEDFSEISYLLANGKYFSIGYLDEGYWKQPEFYPGFKRSGLRAWTEPDPNYWGVVGFGTYPAEQSDELTIGGRENFDAVVFMYSGYGVQTYQGVHLQPSSASRQYFDITIEEPDFILEPSFPRFSQEWAKRVVIHGKRKPTTPDGNYSIEIGVEKPPRELKAGWESKYRNLYYDAQGSLTAGSVLSLNITIK